MATNSPEGFPSGEWGPGLWRFMHMAALNIHPKSRNESPAEYRQYIGQYMNFFRSLGFLMPCGMCRREYQLMTERGKLALTPARFKNRQTAFDYTVALHQKVSARLGKGKFSRKTAVQWAKEYERLRHKNVENIKTKASRRH